MLESEHSQGAQWGTRPVRRTPCPDPWLAAYLADIARYPVLDRAQELDLARRHFEGDAEASELLVGAHLRDVTVIARRYLGYGHSLAELVGEGNLGLVLALDRFEPERGLRFMTYAGYWVRAEILEFVMNTWADVGVGKSSLATRLFFGLAREQGRLEARGYDTTDLRAALAASFGCSVARVDQMAERLSQRGADPNVGWLCQPHGDPEALLLAAERVERSIAQVGAALAQLDPRERTIVELRLLADRPPSLVEVGRQLGISRERVRQLESRARAKLADQLQEWNPQGWNPALGV